MTLSIVGIDPGSGAFGSAVASCSLAVGGTVAHSRLGVGVVNTQHQADLAVGEEVLDAMERGASPQEALERVLGADPGAARRQLVAIDREGRAGAWTGADCERERAQLVAERCAAAGNMLVRAEVVEAMVAAFEASEGELLGDRLLRALEAGDALGGDRRGRQAAALRVVPPRGAEIPINLDLRVDDHRDPLRELRRLRELFHAEFER